MFGNRTMPQKRVRTTDGNKLRERVTATKRNKLLERAIYYDRSIPKERTNERT